MWNLTLYEKKIAVLKSKGTIFVEKKSLFITVFALFAILKTLISRHAVLKNRTYHISFH